MVPMQRTRLERRPWRIVWWCAVCGKQSRALVSEDIAATMIGWDRAYGMSVSMREVAEMVGVSLDDLNAAIEDELS